MILKEVMPINIKTYFRKKRFWAGVLLVQFFLFYSLSKSETAVLFFSQFFETKKHLHQLVFNKIPFSIGDIFYVLIVAFFVILIYRLFKKDTRSKSGFHLLIFLNLFYFIYQFFWGMQYFQKPILAKLPKEEISVLEAKNLSLKYLKICKADRKNVEENTNGVFIIPDLNEVKITILKNQKSLPEDLVQKQATSINDFKPSLFRNVMSYTGIFGYYNPFTAEAQYNAKLPATYLAFTLAHESAHQLGFAREQEASFVAYLVGKNSKCKPLKYATDLFVLKSLLSYIQESDSIFVKKIILNYSTEMQRDRKNDKIFIKNHQGVLDDAFAVTNNLFLKSNQQAGSITYSYFTEMLIKYERLNP